MINDHQIDDLVLNKIENRLESWCDHHRHHHSGRLTEIDLSQLSKVKSRNLEKGKSSGFQPAHCPWNGLNRNFAFYAYKTEHSVVP